VKLDRHRLRGNY